MNDAYQYVHDSEKHTVYRFPARPQVMPQPMGRTKRKKIYHYVSMVIDVVRADNLLDGHRWKYPTSEHPHFTYDDRYDADEAARYFMLHYAPRGERIGEARYDELVLLYGSRR